MRIWATRLLSLAVYVALWTAWVAAMPHLNHVKSTVRIESELPQSEVLRRLSDAGIEAKEIKISKWGPFGPLATFVERVPLLRFRAGHVLRSSRGCQSGRGEVVHASRRIPVDAGERR